MAAGSIDLTEEDAADLQFPKGNLIVLVPYNLYYSISLWLFSSISATISGIFKFRVHFKLWYFCENLLLFVVYSF